MGGAGAAAGCITMVVLAFALFALLRGCS